ncbi:MAG: Mut7-C RNAse domain-containing protein [Elainellaceae cyanobacterium]
MLHVEFRFYGNLNDFLKLERRQRSFTHQLQESASIKDVIESLGVPHPEIDLLLVHGEPVDFTYLMQDGDRVSVYPLFYSLPIQEISPVHAPLPTATQFIADVHLGKLATNLRLLGFDVLYENDYPDQELAEVAARERRIVLTCDRGLLKRNLITYGYCLRSRDPFQQTVEVLQRFGLVSAIVPFQRCLRCNGLLQEAPKATVADCLPPLVQQHHDQFRQCQQCQQVYWQGSHYEKLQKLVDSILAACL